jgi:hypothetical protein
MSNWLVYAPRTLGGVAATFVLFGLPLAWAFAAGIESARRPEHRNAARPSRFFFRQGFHRSLGWECPIIWWGTLIVGSCWAFFFAHHFDARGHKTEMSLMSALSFPMIFFGMAFWVAAACFFWAPRRREESSLALWALGSAAFAWIAVEIFVRIFVGEGGVVSAQTFVYESPYWDRNSGYYSYRQAYYDIAPFFQCLLGSLFLAWTWRAARSEGDNWFFIDQRR